MMKPKLILVMGFPGSGKSTYTERLVKQGYTNINRDMFDEPGKIYSSKDFHEIQLRKLLKTKVNIVVDNTYPTVESRKLPILFAMMEDYEVECWWLKTTIEETEYNVATRMIKRYGKLVAKDESEKTKADSNIFGASVLFAYQKKFEKPTNAEGFDDIKELKFVREYDKSYTNKAIILDYDGTLRTTNSGKVAPNKPEDVVLLPNRTETINKYVKKGYIILGVSNQAGIARGYLTREDAIACFEQTNKLLKYPVNYKFCEHNVPINCYCRKPMPGLGVEFIEEYKLDPSHCIMVGDMTSDKTFAKRCGFQYVDQAEFFKV